MLISKIKGQGQERATLGGWPYNMSALGKHIFLILTVAAALLQSGLLKHMISTSHTAEQ